jgi:peptidoglycan/xylan/chitin deacetylase (PgdA/CDA1 family)
VRATRYSDVRQPTARSVFRGSTLDGLAAYYSLAGKIEKALKTNRVHFLVLHHVFEDEATAFRDLIVRLGTDHEFITYSDAVDRVVSGRFDKPYLSVSFDDGIKNCLLASRIMDDYGVKGCFFVCPSMVGEQDPAKVAAFSRLIGMPPVDYLSWDDIDALVANGHEIGGHSMTHFNLAEASPDRLADEIGGNYATLLPRIGRPKHFAWPFGEFQHFTPEAARVVFAMGFESCASALRGCHTVGVADRSQLCLRREDVVAKHPLRHHLYFMARSVETSGPDTGAWPAGWSVGSR